MQELNVIDWPISRKALSVMRCSLVSRLMSYTSHALTQYPPLTPFPAHFVVTTAYSCADNGICSSCAPDKGARDRRHGSRWQRDSGGYC